MVSPSWGASWGTPFYEGGGSTILAPYVTEVALGGHAYMIDWSAEIPLRHFSIPILRQQQDTSEQPGEQSINSEGLWRRAGESWHLGAGQERYDRDVSSRYRFHISQGVNIWRRWELELLKTVELVDADVSASQLLAVAGDYLYYYQGTVLRYTTDLAAAPTVVSGTPATNPQSMCSNGKRVWSAHLTNGIYMTERGTPSTASHITGTISIVSYVKNRVMASHGQSIYDVTSLAVGGGGALPAALFTHGNTDWNWVGFAESQGFIYAAGYSGDKSLIYSITITSDGTALGQPVVAGALPDGEVIACVYGYLGRFLALGTNKGFRLAFVAGDGSLNIGALVETTTTVKCFEGQDRFIWFGWSDFESITTATATGLGRMSTGEFSDLDNFVPAYASDLMAENVSGEVTDICTFQNRRIFTVAGAGLYAEHLTDLVVEGVFDTGDISYGLTELKTALYVDVQISQNASTTGTVEIMVSVDGGAFVSLGVATYAQLRSFSVGELAGAEFELRIRLSRDGINPAISPSLLSWLLRVQPRPLVTNMILATILLAPSVETLVDGIVDYDTLHELDYIERINQTKEVVTFQHNTRLYSVVLEDYEMGFHKLIEDTEGYSGFNGSCVLKLKKV